MRGQLLRTYLVLKKIVCLDSLDFEERLTMQKKVYLLQLFGIELGYRFNWYKHGPYCQKLADDNYEIKFLKTQFSQIEKNYNLNNNFEKKLTDFNRLLNRVEDNITLLEAIASVHYLKHVGFVKGDVNENNIQKVLRKYNKDFSKNIVNKSWNILSEFRLLENSSI